MSSHAALTAKYRPQTFADVAGQETLKAILSRASQEDKAAPAYLFSGTRGVGKTTLARIFAKALNCRTAPTAEPCNVCDQCRAVTSGSSVDVVEIDGASNRGIDDVRRLKEVVGYAPMEGRYKIFIIDEAHMLSREAFNALLKTLEEPPARVTFIMATTEPHKFPATIISRCQHYVFKRLPEAGLVAHLEGVLCKEGVEFDPAAVRLIARRGAGSVRDSMSLLGQVLALGAERLTEDSVRNVLGLAGHEAFMQLLKAVQGGDIPTLAGLLRELLDQGLDMGFFLRELSTLWRNLFILKQSGAAGLSAAELSENEAAALMEAAKEFSLSHIHACWQMTLEGQRRVLTALEPASALELLLLNLAMLPQLLSLENLSAIGRRTAPPQSSGGTGASGPAGQGGPRPAGNFERGVPPDQGREGGRREQNLPPPDSEAAPFASAEEPPHGSDDPRDSFFGQAESAPEQAPASPPPSARPLPDFEAQTVAVPAEADPPAPAEPESFAPAPATAVPPVPSGSASGSSVTPANASSAVFADAEDDSDEDEIPEPEHFYAPPPDYDEALPPGGCLGPEELFDAPPVPGRGGTIDFDDPASDSPAEGERPADADWNAALEYAAAQSPPPWFLPLVRKITASWSGNTLVLRAPSEFTAEQLAGSPGKELLEAALAGGGTCPPYRFSAPKRSTKSHKELEAEVLAEPAVQEVMRRFNAKIINFGETRRPS